MKNTWEEMTLRSLGKNVINILVEEGNVKAKCSFLYAREMDKLLKIIIALQNYYDEHAEQPIDPLIFFRNILTLEGEEFELSSLRRTIEFRYDNFIMRIAEMNLDILT